MMRIHRKRRVGVTARWTKFVSALTGLDDRSIIVVASGAPRAGARSSTARCRSRCRSFPPTTGGTSTSRGAARRQQPELHQLHQQAAPPAASRLGRLGGDAGQPRRDLRHPLHRRARRRSRCAGDLRATTTRATSARRAGRPAIRFPSRRRRSRAGSKAAARATSTRPTAIATCCSSIATTGILYELYQRAAGTHGSTAGKPAPAPCSRSTTNLPPARHAGRAPTPRAWRSCPASCATTRRSAPSRSATRSASPCAPPTATSIPASHRAGTTPRRAADGRAAAAEGERQHLRLSRRTSSASCRR